MSDADPAAQREDLTEVFAAYAQSRDPALRDELVAAHLNLAKYLARRFANRGEPLDDLIQVASLGLVNAVDRFDVGQGVAFSTFATPTILGELKRYFRDKGWALRVPRRVQELTLELARSVSELSHELGRSPTITEISQSIGVSEDRILEAMEASEAYRAASLDTPGERSPVETAALTGPDQYAESDTRMELAALMERLEPRDREILQLRFFEGLTQSEIGDQLGISQVHVSRLITRAITVLRDEQRKDVSWT